MTGDDELDRMRGILDDLLTAAENYFTARGAQPVSMTLSSAKELTRAHKRLKTAMHAAHAALAGDD